MFNYNHFVCCHMGDTLFGGMHVAIYMFLSKHLCKLNVCKKKQKMWSALLMNWMKKILWLQFPSHTYGGERSISSNFYLLWAWMFLIKFSWFKIAYGEWGDEEKTSYSSKTNLSGELCHERRLSMNRYVSL